MTGLLFNKYKGDKVRVWLAHESGQVLDEEQLAFLADPRVADTVMISLQQKLFLWLIFLVTIQTSSPRESFKNFDNGLYNEINEVKAVLNQMEAAVE
ncbi:hypothetical protein Tco_0175539 [Tanacetum coccineum]